LGGGLRRHLGGLSPPKPKPSYVPGRLSVVCPLSSVCRPSVCLSVTLVHPTQVVVILRNTSTALGSFMELIIAPWVPWPSFDSLKISRRSFQGNPSAAGAKHKRSSQVGL